MRGYVVQAAMQGYVVQAAMRSIPSLDDFHKQGKTV
jgi:hypothetical protein